MPSPSSHLTWPRTAVPVIRSGGRFPMVAHNAGLVYTSPGTVALHLHDYTGEMWLGGRRLALRPGDFTLTPAGMPSNYDLAAPGHHLCVHFDAVMATGPTVKLPLHWRPALHEQRLSERLWEVIQLFRRGDAPADVLARQAAGTVLQGLLLWLAVTVAEGPVQPAPGRVEADLEKVRRHLDEHFRAPLDVPDLARRFGVSQNYLARRFRARHGVTLQRYLLGRRVEFARHLITVTQLPLKAVAFESGLGNSQYFHRQFRLVTGHSPSAERARALAKNSAQ